jgi:16S rRNA (uracil1498-N3)-methyltransferase
MSEPFEETWFYAPLEAVGDEVELPKEEAHHLRHVLRVRPGQTIVATNGRGKVFLCETRDKAGRVDASAREVLVDQASPPRLHVVLGLLRGRDTEEPVGGICQMDVAAIHLVTTDHTQEFKGQDHGRLLERLRHKSLAALKQAKKAWMTSIHPPLPLREWRKGNAGDLILVHPGEDRLGPMHPGNLYLLIGPEGGFSGAEIRWLREEESAFTMGLGATRIRGTHAPLVAIGKLMGLEST